MRRWRNLLIGVGLALCAMVFGYFMAGWLISQIDFHVPKPTPIQNRLERGVEGTHEK